MPDTSVLDLFTAAMIADGEWELVGIEPSYEAFVDAFQFLIDTGAAWQLQGRVGRTARDLILSGDCVEAR